MAILSQDELMKAIQKRIGEDKSDEALSFLEDITDTFEDLSKRTVDNSGEIQKQLDELQEKYNNLDNEWRTKYQSRFFEGVMNEPDNQDKSEVTEDVPQTFDELFTEGEE